MRWRYFVPGSNAGAPKTTDDRKSGGGGDDDKDDDKDGDGADERDDDDGRRVAPGVDSMSDLCVCHVADMDVRRVLRRAGALCSSARLTRGGAVADDSRRWRWCSCPFMSPTWSVGRSLLPLCRRGPRVVLFFFFHLPPPSLSPSLSPSFCARLLAAPGTLCHLLCRALGLSLFFLCAIESLPARGLFRARLSGPPSPFFPRSRPLGAIPACPWCFWVGRRVLPFLFPLLALLFCLLLGVRRESAADSRYSQSDAISHRGGAFFSFLFLSLSVPTDNNIACGAHQRRQHHQQQPTHRASRACDQGKRGKKGHVRKKPVSPLSRCLLLFRLPLFFLLSSLFLPFIFHRAVRAGAKRPHADDFLSSFFFHFFIDRKKRRLFTGTARGDPP